MEDVTCPYCESQQEINHDDGYGYDEFVLYQQQCVDCDKYFTFTTSIRYSYTTRKADCLNNGEHNWKAITDYPIEYTRMKCVDCEAIRRLTEEEWLEIKSYKLSA